MQNKIEKTSHIVSCLLLVVVLGISQNVFAAERETGINLNTEIAEVISLGCGTGTVNMGNLTPGTPVTGEVSCSATTNSNGGYTIAVKRDDASGATIDNDADSSIEIADKASWDVNSPNAQIWSGTGLGFTVYSSTANKNTAWWGTGTTLNDPDNKYAGFPTTQTDIMTSTGYQEASTETRIGFKMDIPASQRSGSYSGAITFQTTTTP